MSVRFRIHPNGTATLAGVGRNDLRSVFDAASIHYHEDLARERDKKKPDQQMVDFLRHQLQVLDDIRRAVDSAIAATFPPRQPPTIKERMEAVLRERRERALFEGVLDQIMAEATARTSAPAARTRGRRRQR